MLLFSKFVGQKMSVIRVLFYSMFLIFLSGCNHSGKFCAIEDYHFQPTLDHAASYRVHGKRYIPLASSKNYQEQGTASWYGKRFNKKRTSSGERYNMQQMTAAHKTLPFNTKLLVTNLKNGKQVIVKINDRGPFVSHRIIDLSYAAAKKIGMLGRGTTDVQVKAIEET